MTVIYSSELTSTRQSPVRSTAILPLLVILFIVSYGILAMLVFEQGQTIESQRSLIREMLKDSTQLAALKEKAAHDDIARAHDKTSLATDQKHAADSGSAPADAKGPGTEGNAVDKGNKHPGKSAHATKEIPGKPAADLEDVRRSTRVI